MPSYGKLRNILHSVMYHDTAMIKRPRLTEAEDGSDDYETDAPEVIYADIPCKLSQYGKEQLASASERNTDISEDLRLCCDPDLQILENDIVDVFHEGQHFLLRAGKRFAYPTHQEISCRRKKEAGNGCND